jgi:hypothetical protein
MAPKPAKLHRGGPPTYGLYYDAPGGLTVEGCMFEKSNVKHPGYDWSELCACRTSTSAESRRHSAAQITFGAFFHELKPSTD